MSPSLAAGQFRMPLRVSQGLLWLFRVSPQRLSDAALWNLCEASLS